MGGGNGVVLGDPVPDMPEIMIAPADESGASPPAFPSGFGGGFGGELPKQIKNNGLI